MPTRTRSLLRIVILCVIALPGCGGCNGCNRQQGFVGEETVRGQNLKRALAEQHDLSPATPGDLPLRLKIAIDTEHDNKGTRYRPKLIWNLLPGERATLEKTLARRVADQRPGLRQGEPLTLKLTLLYRDQQGQRCDTDHVTLDLKHDEDTLVLTNLGESAVPFRAAAELESVVWLEPEATVAFQKALESSTSIENRPSVPLKVPANLPLRLELVKGDAGGKEPSSRLPRLQWFRIGNRDGLLALLRSHLADQAPDLTGRAIKNCTMTLVLKDAQGQVLGTDRVVLDLQQDQGFAPLRDLGTANGPGTLVIVPTETVWQERREVVQLGK
jgi:hypothetical protein